MWIILENAMLTEIHQTPKEIQVLYDHTQMRQLEQANLYRQCQIVCFRGQMKKNGEFCDSLSSVQDDKKVLGKYSDMDA